MKHVYHLTFYENNEQYVNEICSSFHKALKRITHWQEVYDFGEVSCECWLPDEKAVYMRLDSDSDPLYGVFEIMKLEVI